MRTFSFGTLAFLGLHGSRLSSDGVRPRASPNPGPSIDASPQWRDDVRGHDRPSCR